MPTANPIISVATTWGLDLVAFNICEDDDTTTKGQYVLHERLFILTSAKVHSMTFRVLISLMRTMDDSDV